MGWLKILGLILSLAQFLPRITAFIKNSREFWVAVSSTWAGHIASDKPVKETIKLALVDTRECCKAHLNPEIASVSSRSVDPKLLEEWEKLKTPDVTTVPDYLQKYVEDDTND